MKEKKAVVPKRSFLISVPLANKFDELKARLTLAEGKKAITETILEKWITQELERLKNEK
jgi:hypothetical protein